MDGLFRKLKYEEYMQKLSDAKNSVGAQMEAKGVKNKVDFIFDSLLERNDKSENTILLLILAVPLFLVCLYQIYVYGFGIRILILLGLVVFLIINRSRLQGVIKTATEKSKSLNTDAESTISRISYIEAGLDVKQTRTSMTRNFYVLFFPLLMISLGELFSGPFTTVQYIVLLLVAFFVGGIFWYKFFDEDIQELEFTRTDLEDVRAKALI